MINPPAPSHDADHGLRVHGLRVQRIELLGELPWRRVDLSLSGSGTAEALDTLTHFFNASWLCDSELPYLGTALQLPPGEGLSLREEGWAVREPHAHGDWVRVAASFGEAGALLPWGDWLTALQVLQRFLQLMQRYPKGVPRYAADQGFRVRLSG